MIHFSNALPSSPPSSNICLETSMRKINPSRVPHCICNKSTEGTQTNTKEGRIISRRGREPTRQSTQGINISVAEQCVYTPMIGRKTSTFAEVTSRQIKCFFCNSLLSKFEILPFYNQWTLVLKNKESFDVLCDIHPPLHFLHHRRHQTALPSPSLPWYFRRLTQNCKRSLCVTIRRMVQMVQLPYHCVTCIMQELDFTWQWLVCLGVETSTTLTRLDKFHEESAGQQIQELTKNRQQMDQQNLGKQERMLGGLDCLCGKRGGMGEECSSGRVPSRHTPFAAGFLRSMQKNWLMSSQIFDFFFLTSHFSALGKNPGAKLPHFEASVLGTNILN